jgi:LPXTG-motif cell wall-anchored protein
MTAMRTIAEHRRSPAGQRWPRLAAVALVVGGGVTAFAGAAAAVSSSTPVAQAKPGTVTCVDVSARSGLGSSAKVRIYSLPSATGSQPGADLKVAASARSGWLVSDARGHVRLCVRGQGAVPPTTRPSVRPPTPAAPPNPGPQTPPAPPNPGPQTPPAPPTPGPQTPPTPPPGPQTPTPPTPPHLEPSPSTTTIAGRLPETGSGIGIVIAVVGVALLGAGALVWIAGRVLGPDPE